jgi:hypothetical protein
MVRELSDDKWCDIWERPDEFFHMDNIKEILAMLGRVTANLAVVFAPLMIVIMMEWVERRTKR